MPRSLLPAAVVTAALIGCSGDGRSGPAAIAESDAFACEAVLSPGPDDDGRLGAVAPGPDGLVAWTTDWDDTDVSVGRGMAEAVNVGRRGSGPGEFEDIQRLGWMGDTLWTSDTRNARVQYFDRSGSYLGATLTGGYDSWTPRTGGRFVTIGSKSIGLGSWSLLGRGISGPEVPPDTIFTFPGPDMERVTIPMGGGSSILTTPDFAPEAMVGYADDGSRFCGTEPLPGNEVRLRCVDDRGTVLRDTVVALPPVPLSDELWEATISGYLRRDGVTREGIAAAIPRPASLPLVTGMRVGADGAVWLLRSHRADSLQRWLRYRPDGAASGTLIVARGRSVGILRGDTTWMIATDGDGMQSLERCVAK